MSIGNLKEQFINSPEFQKNWKKYKKSFGNEIDELFKDNIDYRITIYRGLGYLYNREFNRAYHTIRHLVQCCKNETEISFVEKLIQFSYNEEEISKVSVGDYLKRDTGGGYYLVVGKTDEQFIIKECFDFEFNYIDESRRIDYFKITFSDLRTFQFASNSEIKRITNYLNKNNEKARFLKYTDKMIALRNEILNSNFNEASDDYRQFNFYRILNDKVAFIVNLRDKGDFIEATYGFTTIVDLNYFKECGENNDNIKLRYQKRIINESDELNLRTEIEKVYNLYKNISKEDLLKLKKEKQKEFINKINNRLKPLGFKKKNTKWNKLLDNNFTLEIFIYKSQWSDVYYFDVSLYDPDGKDYSYNRINTNGMGTYNWQVLTDEEINNLIDYIIDNAVEPIIEKQGK